MDKLRKIIVLFIFVYTGGSNLWIGPNTVFGASQKPFTKASTNELFSHTELGIGRDHHYSAANRRYFTNIVDVAAGDLDGDGHDDIVLLADCVPYNGAYSAGVTTYAKLNYWANSQYDPVGGTGAFFLSPGDYLYDIANLNSNFTTSFNPLSSLNNWNPAAPITGHWSPPSPNIVAGIADGYSGSDLAWLKGDGRGFFELRFIFANGAPVRIKFGKKVQLRDLSADGKLDILLISGGGENWHGWTGDIGTTSVQPLTGSSRVFWLENQGWSGSNLYFVDRNIAEGLPDRPGTLLAFNNPVNKLVLNPVNAIIKDVDGDTRNDVVVVNVPGDEGYSFFPHESHPNYLYNGTPSTTTLAAQFNVPTSWLPKIGFPGSPSNDYWDGGSQPPVLIWYKDINTSGPPEFSTTVSSQTYHRGRKLNGNNPEYPNLTPREGPNLHFIKLNAGGIGEEAVLAMKSWQMYSGWIYRRIKPFSAGLVLSNTPIELQNVPGNANGHKGCQIGDLDGDGNEEIVTVNEDSGITEIFSVTPVSTDSVSLTRSVIATGVSGHWGLLFDVNNDGKLDIIPFADYNGGCGNYYFYPFKVLINKTTSVGNFVFDLVEQRTTQPNDWGFRNGGFANSLHVFSIKIGGSAAVGDFNNDGFKDIVRVSPYSAVSVFMNKCSLFPRVRVTATVRQASGSYDLSKTWSAVFQGRSVGGNITISTTPTGGFSSEPGQWTLSE